MNRFPFLRLVAAVTFAMCSTPGIMAQVATIGPGCPDLPLALQYAGAPVGGTVLTIGNPLPPGQNWWGILVLGAVMPTPVQIFDPSLIACYDMPSGQPAAAQIWVNPVVLYGFVSTGGTVSGVIPPGLQGLSFAAQGAYGHAALRVTDALSFTIQ